MPRKEVTEQVSERAREEGSPWPPCWPQGAGGTDGAPSWEQASRLHWGEAFGAASCGPSTRLRPKFSTKKHQNIIQARCTHFRNEKICSPISVRRGGQSMLWTSLGSPRQGTSRPKLPPLWCPLPRSCRLLVTNGCGHIRSQPPWDLSPLRGGILPWLRWVPTRLLGGLGGRAA